MAGSRQSEAGGRTVEGQATLRGLGGRPTKLTPELAFKVYEPEVRRLARGALSSRGDLEGGLPAVAAPCTDGAEDAGAHAAAIGSGGEGTSAPPG